MTKNQYSQVELSCVMESKKRDIAKDLKVVRTQFPKLAKIFPETEFSIILVCYFILFEGHLHKFLKTFTALFKRYGPPKIACPTLPSASHYSANRLKSHQKRH